MAWPCGPATATLDQIALAITIPGLPISVPPIENESGAGTFFKYDSATFLNSQGGLNTLAISAGCTIFQYSGSAYVDPILPPGLDLGPALNVTGPNGTKQMTKTATGEYSGTFSTPSLSLTTPPTKFLTPGSYTVDNGTGGTDVGPFKASITVPTPVTWSNKSLVSNVPRSQPLDDHLDGRKRPMVWFTV